VSDVTPDPEDLKIITLARSSRARVAASEGAAVRDETGRTYTAAAVALPSLRLSALRLAVAMAVSSGAQARTRPCSTPLPTAPCARRYVPSRHGSRTGLAGTPSPTRRSTRSLSP